ncbi:homing endonuclease associated repeat-containing protein [Sebaldella sp. S0638]|uniref:homing endonuclease associated repeat-containing protein n=1 Tax=Sebaldella sp. S0638 TaxID=2957809 RepID=UPI00209D6B84|nr:hypothetical protein [Sebaldella sp. S0638]
MKKISDDDLLNQMRAFYKKNGKISIKLFSSDKSVCDSSTVIKRFGSWNAAIEKSGLAMKMRAKKEEMRKIQKIEIKKMVKEFIEKNGRLPLKKEYLSSNGLPHMSKVVLFYGHKSNLYAELGYKEKQFSVMLSREQIIEKIQNFYKREGREPRAREFTMSNDLPTDKDIEMYFNGKVEAKIAAGFKLSERSKKYTRKEVIEALKTFYEREGRNPLKTDMKAINSLPPLRAVRALFGTVRVARERSGLKSFGKKETSILREDFEELLVKRYMEKGKRLTNMEIERDEDLPSVVAILGNLGIQKLPDAWEYIEKKYKLNKK